MIGGIFIAAMLGNTRFFMEFDYYRGVKLTFILPLILTAFGYMRRFRFSATHLVMLLICRVYERFPSRAH